MDNSNSQRREYGDKNEIGHDKLLTSKHAEMTKGGSVTGQDEGPTGSMREYPKSGNPRFEADFNPIKDKKRSGTRWAVGGVD